MKFLTFNKNKVGFVKHKDMIIDITELLKEKYNISSMEDLVSYPKYELIISYLNKIEGEYIKTKDIEFNPPISNPKNIICSVNNYARHAEEMRDGIFPKPIFFLKPSDVLIGNHGTVEIPRNCERVDYELELCIIIGKKGKRISKNLALEHIFGYSIFLDISARDFMSVPHTWFGIKAWDTFGPIGPYIVTRDEIADPQALSMKLYVNDVIKMQANTSEMIFKISELIEAASEVTTLYPGDIIATGTIYGVGSIKKGDTIKAEIENIGALYITTKESMFSNKFYGDDFPRIYKKQLNKWLSI